MDDEAVAAEVMFAAMDRFGLTVEEAMDVADLIAVRDE